MRPAFIIHDQIVSHCGRQWIGQLEQRSGVKVAFWPLFQDWKRYAGEFAPLSVGFSDWGWRSAEGNRRGWRVQAGQAHAMGKLWMAPVAPQDHRRHAQMYWEASNSEAYRVMWQNAIETGADWVQIITWNDYSESTEIAPSSGTGYSFYDLTAYYTTWFKMGRSPKITRDVLFYFHRTQPTWVLPDFEKQPRPMRFVPETDDAQPRNDIELLAFLKAPGELEVEIGKHVYRSKSPAGMTSFRVPLVPGNPIFRLWRGGKIAVETRSPHTITREVTYQNLLYHGGSSTRLQLSPLESK